MSIINEALKKTESDLQKKTGQVQAAKPGTFNIKHGLIYILILVGGLFLGNFIFKLLKDKTQAEITMHKDALTPTITLPLETPKPLPTPPQETEETIDSNFVLNGVFLSDSGAYALINNQIVREDDDINGAKVKLITHQTVELDNAGQTITLSTNQ